MKAIALVAFQFISVALYSQSIFVGGEFGYNTYNMNSLKSYQASAAANLSAQLGVNVKVVDNFPAYYGYKVFAGRSFGENHTLGLFVNYYSTGGRISYNDYSGTLVLDQLVHAVSPGVYWQYRINRSNVWPIFFEVGTSVVYNHYEAKDYLAVGTQPENSSTTAHSVNLGFIPGLMIRRNIGSFFLQAGVRYEVQTHGTLKESSGHLTSQGQSVVVEWDGVRLSAGGGWKFGGKN